MLASLVIAMIVLKRQRKMDLTSLGKVVEASLMSAGVIILITSAGGAFGAMLTAANIKEAITGMFQDTQVAGVLLLLVGFVVSALLKVAQGSSTVAMITAAATPENTADKGSKSSSATSDSRRAMVVLPLPGGPQRIMEARRPAATIRPIGPSACSR
jgi:H+/gluconate symporter-like permease